MGRSVVMRGFVGGPDVAEWCWADVVLRGRASDRPPKWLRSPSPQAEVRHNLSTSPLEDQSGQVDRLISTFFTQKETGRKANVESSPTIEDEFVLAQGWVEAFARLDYARPPADVPSRRWVQLIDDIARFMNGEFIHKAARLGWTALDLFGCDPEKPFARIDQQGLCWLIAGNRLIHLSESGAIIETWTGARQTWRPKPSEPDRVLPWQLKV
jgi:hypothetical protein